MAGSRENGGKTLMAIELEMIETNRHENQNKRREQKQRHERREKRESSPGRLQILSENFGRI